MSKEPTWPARCFNKRCPRHDDSESGCESRSVYMVDLCHEFNATNNNLLYCAHCGGVIDSTTLLGEMIFRCSNCSAETRFKKAWLSLEKQIERFKRRAV